MRIFRTLLNALDPFKSRRWQAVEKSLLASAESVRVSCHAYDAFEYETKSQLAPSAARSPSRHGG